MRKLVLFIACLCLIPVPAFADTEFPTVAWGIPTNAEGKVNIQIQGPKWAWGTRQVAGYIDDRVNNVKVYKWGKCRDRVWAHCVRVYVKNFGETDWIGLMTRNLAGDTILKYNTYYLPYFNNKHKLSRAVGCHETLHGFGMDHHNQRGCLRDELIWPSDWEMKVLKQYYD